MKQTVTPFLWFDKEAEEAMDFYVEVFSAKGGQAKILHKTPGPEGKMMYGEMELNGQKFMLLNAGPHHKFNEAVSFFVQLDTQDEVDHYWEKLTEDGGEESQCGWLKDKFGLSWQIVPRALGMHLGNPDPEKAGRAMQAMLKMKKIVIKDLEDAVK